MRNATKFRFATVMAVAATCCIAFAAQAAPIGPVFPPPGGVTNTPSGSGAGDAGGRTFSFSGFDGSAFSSLYWGASSANLPSAGLDGTLYSMTFIGTSGATAIWQTTSPYTNPSNNVTSSVAIFLQVDVAGLGATPWITATSVGLPSSIGVVIDDSAASPFSANILFTAGSVGGTPVNLLQQFGGGLTRTNFGGGFYYEAASVPEPGSLALIAAALLGFVPVRRLAVRRFSATCCSSAAA